jgi:hypothetical protein
VEQWAQYLAVEPDLGTRIDVQTGIIGASNLWPHQKKGKRKIKVRELMPKWGRRRGKSSGLAFLAWAMSNGAKPDPSLMEKLKG